MFSIDLIQVVTLWCLAGMGVISAINASGLAKQIVSWLIVIAITVAAIFFSYMKVETVKQEIGLNEIKSEPRQNAVPDSNSATARIVNDSSGENYLFAERQLLANILTISDSILSFPKWQSIVSQGIEKREYYENKALFLRNNSMNYYRQTRSLSPPTSKKESYDSLLAAADNLRLAGYEVHYQFALESDTLGETINKARERASQAKSLISTITGKE